MNEALKSSEVGQDQGVDTPRHIGNKAVTGFGLRLISQLDVSKEGASAYLAMRRQEYVDNRLKGTGGLPLEDQEAIADLAGRNFDRDINTFLNNMGIK